MVPSGRPPENDRDGDGRPDHAQARRRIEEVAAELFERDGYSRVTLARVAEAAGVCEAEVGCLYRSKQEIVEAVLRAPMARLRDRVAPLAADGATFEDGRAVLDRVVDLFTDRPRDALLILDYLNATDTDLRTPAGPHPVRDVASILGCALSSACRRGVIHVEAPELLLLLAQLVLSHPTLVHQDTAGPHPPDARTLADRRATCKAWLHKCMRAFLSRK